MRKMWDGDNYCLFGWLISKQVSSYSSEAFGPVKLFSLLKCAEKKCIPQNSLSCTMMKRQVPVGPPFVCVRCLEVGKGGGAVVLLAASDYICKP